MRRRIVRAGAVAVMLCGAGLAVAYSTGPPESRTGAPAIGGLPAEGLCTVCHVGAVNAPEGALRILDAPASYVPGASYAMRVRLDYAHPASDTLPFKWGFEMTAVQVANGQGAGTFDVTGDAGLQIKSPTPTSVFKSRRYLEHTSLGTHTGESAGDWVVRWVEPATDVGPVRFFAAGNAANGDGTNIGDHIFTTSAQIASTDTASVVGVPHGPPLPYTTELDPPYPNPFRRFADLSFSVARPARVDLAVFDLTGRRVRTLRRGMHAGGLDGSQWNGDREDGSLAPNGLYFVRLAVEGERTLSRRVTLMR